MIFKTKPYQHQLDAFEKCKDLPYFALFADMGTGKTKITIDICAYNFLQKRIEACLIIAPNHIHSQWINEQFPLHCSVPYKKFLWQSSKANGVLYKNTLGDFLIDITDKLKVLAVNVEAFQSDSILKTIAEYVKNHKTFIIVDEATRIKHNTARRTKMVHKLNKYGIRCILTGTPTAKSPFDLWSQFEFLKENFFDCNYFIFQHRYGILMKSRNTVTNQSFYTLIDEKTFNITRNKIIKLKEQRGGKLMPNDYEALSVIIGISEKNVRYIENQELFTKYKRIDELKNLITPITYSVKKIDCLDLPEKIYEKIYVDMSIEQRKIYNNLKNEMLATYNEDTLTVLNKVALTTRLMQVCGGFFPYTDEEDKSQIKMIGEKNIKVERLLEDLDEVDFNSTKVIVWCQFVMELRLVYKELSKIYNCALYYGKTSNDNREKIKKDFSEGLYDIFIGNKATAGFGLNLQNATLQYDFSNGYNTENTLQAEDRSHRIGVKQACVYKSILIKGTIDEKIYNNIKEGRDLNDFFKSNSLSEIIADIPEEE